VGSALGGLGARLRRHARLTKRRHWHVDALREVASLVAVVARPGRERLECAVAAQVCGWPGASRPVPRFGASDCRCAGHLIHVDRRPALDLDDCWTVTLLGADGMAADLLDGPGACLP
jgi:sugar fermentation stimulation protein A